MKLLYAWLFSHVLVPAGISQTDTGNAPLWRGKQKPVFSLGAGVQHGFIFAHSPAVENTKGANPTGVELTFSWQRNDQAVWDLCNCFPRKGLLLAYYDYDTRILGKSVTAAYFLEPSYRLGKNIFFSFNTAVGVSYLTNPSDSVHNPTNLSYSTHLSGYLRVGTGLWFRLNDHWWLNGSINYQHESNGGLKEPNKGINWPTAGIALSYQHNPRAYYRGVRKKDKFWKDLPVRWDAGIFGMAKRVVDEHGQSRRLLLAGLSFQGSKQVGRIQALTAGAEIFTDRALRYRLKQDTLDASATRAALLLGHEFLLGKFIFSQRLGIYVFNPSGYFDDVYHRWGIHYRIDRHWGAGFHLLAHRHVADFIDLRLTWSWPK
jgi:hypothetical protein